ncbi:hypothetical protein PHYBLDRAFT_171123 [Phycomyces blakesleeanus NRRL 1555(-)]|uniref:Secreted protein n=1 Tax=Phycomyces blakesleeanus (strain ATCC 8743b / DSM 1359 / FGSC 10004 / NBRC 33097 / NRRL 1555) TaxID=763407 RepID=A0A163DGG5_PHYB8|nr:hypothetical protein PHYBLDRAFT_171123 [Phycomyces blakesleeanus NRRL 1555(-)]OAD71060.1 hypothetical protein PHYBLDRAFT_171123 [Phycomyces blakesleeanus NRRL 1555(-)]|eukprot:XP_018289100.1 hypothetical protein PHYBLDRAFT_171123 [Phycomyces blakesleeanus NRRL 1555(-)]
MNVYILSFFTLLRTFILLADLQCYQSLYGVLSSVSKEGSQGKAQNSVIEIFSFSEISVLLRFSVFQLLRLSFFQLLRLSVFQFFSFSEISCNCWTFTCFECRLQRVVEFDIKKIRILTLCLCRTRFIRNTIAVVVNQITGYLR